VCACLASGICLHPTEAARNLASAPHRNALLARASSDCALAPSSGQRYNLSIRRSVPWSRQRTPRKKLLLPPCCSPCSWRRFCAHTAWARSRLGWTMTRRAITFSPARSLPGSHGPCSSAPMRDARRFSTGWRRAACGCSGTHCSPFGSPPRCVAWARCCSPICWRASCLPTPPPWNVCGSRQPGRS